MQRLIVLVGNIGSGKTTIAKEYVKKGYIVVSRDTIRTMFAGGDYIFDLNTEPIIAKIERYSLLGLLQEGFNVVVDETHTTPKARSRTISVGQEYHYKIIAHVMHKLTRVESVKRRMESAPRGYTKELWREVWDKFDKAYRDPVLAEGFDELILEKAKGKAKHIKLDPGSKTKRSRND